MQAEQQGAFLNAEEAEYSGFSVFRETDIVLNWEFCSR